MTTTQHLNHSRKAVSYVDQDRDGQKRKQSQPLPMTLRRLFFWLHLATGVLVGLVIAFLAVTGSILAFQPQIVDWAERDARILTPVASGCVLPSILLKNAADYEHRSPNSLTLFSDPRRPAEILFGTDVVLLVNRCTGQIIGHGAGRLRGFFLAVRDLHRWVAWSGVRHETLRRIKDACVLAFLFLILSGLVLWFPRKLTWQHLRPTVFFRGSLSGRAREWNWHNVFGFWMALPLTLIALTGTVMSYSWANALLYKAAGSAPLVERAETEPKRPKPLSSDKFPSLNTAIQRAVVQDSQWKSVLMRLPAGKDPNVIFTLDESDGGKPQQRSQLVLARKDGSVVRWEPFGANPRGRRWRLYARFLHTGEIFGITGRIIAFITSLSALILVWTGFSLALRRVASWRRRKAAHTDGKRHVRTNVSSRRETEHV